MNIGLLVSIDQLYDDRERESSIVLWCLDRLVSSSLAIKHLSVSVNECGVRHARDLHVDSVNIVGCSLSSGV